MYTAQEVSMTMKEMSAYYESMISGLAELKRKATEITIRRIERIEFVERRKYRILHIAKLVSHQLKGVSAGHYITPEKWGEVNPPLHIKLKRLRHKLRWRSDFPAQCLRCLP